MNLATSKHIKTNPTPSSFTMRLIEAFRGWCKENRRLGEEQGGFSGLYCNG